MQSSCNSHGSSTTCRMGEKQSNSINQYVGVRFSASSHQIEHRHPSQYLAQPIADDGNNVPYSGVVIPSSSYIRVFLTHCRRPGPFYITYLFLFNELSRLPSTSLPRRRAWPSSDFAMPNAKQRRWLAHALRVPRPLPRVVSSPLASLRLVTRRVLLQRRAMVP